jgi:hypothetical protein
LAGRQVTSARRAASARSTAEQNLCAFQHSDRHLDATARCDIRPPGLRRRGLG